MDDTCSRMNVQYVLLCESFFTQPIDFLLLIVWLPVLKVMLNYMQCELKEHIFGLVSMKSSLSCTVGGPLCIQNESCTMQTKGSQLHYYNLCSNNCIAYFSECYDYINILKRMVFVLVLLFSAYPDSKSTFVWQPVNLEWLLCTGFACCEQRKKLFVLCFSEICERALAVLFKREIDVLGLIRFA